jgi:hypothetical protein
VGSNPTRSISINQVNYGTILSLLLIVVGQELEELREEKEESKDRALEE